MLIFKCLIVGFPFATNSCRCAGLQRWPAMMYVLCYFLHEDWTIASIRSAPGSVQPADRDAFTLFCDIDSSDLDVSLLLSVPACPSSVDNLAVLSLAMA